MDIQVLHKQGLSIRAIARQLDLSRNTVKRYLNQPKKLLTYSKRENRPTKLDPFISHIHKRIALAKPHWIPAAVLFRELKVLGYEGCETTVRNFVSMLRPQEKEPVERFETAPGEQLQVDFTTIKRGRASLNSARY